jgi:ribosomal protein S24E
VRSEEYNPLLKRKELMVEIVQDGGGTPQRLEIRKTIAAKFGTKPETVVVREIMSKTGLSTTECAVDVYDDPASAKRVVPLHVRNRNLPPEERLVKQKKKEKKQAEPSAQAKPTKK